jgi:hypothetical protein
MAAKTMNKYAQRFSLVLTILSFVVNAGCQAKSHSTRNTPPDSTPTVSPTIPPADESSVFFKIEEVSRQQVKDGEELVLLASHESKEGMARFRISLVLKKLGGELPVSFSRGALIRENDSKPVEFLREVAKVLEAKHYKPGKRADRLDLTLAILGQNLSRGSGTNQIAGGFTSEPAGDWITTKVFVADGEGEFFLNLNPKQGIGEISIKDPEYGNIVLKELSRIF